MTNYEEMAIQITQLLTLFTEAIILACDRTQYYLVTVIDNNIKLIY